MIHPLLHIGESCTDPSPWGCEVKVWRGYDCHQHLPKQVIASHSTRDNAGAGYADAIPLSLCMKVVLKWKSLAADVLEGR